MKDKRISLFIDVAFFIVVLLIIVICDIGKSGKEEDKSGSYDFIILEENEEISALYADEQYVYVGTNHGIHIYDPQTMDLVNEINNISMVYTAAIIGDGEGGIWVGHEEGLTHIDKEFNQVTMEFPQIPKGRVNTVAIKNDIVYCGTYNGAASIVNDGGEWKVSRIITKEDGLLCDSVNVILPLKDGIIYGSYLDSNGGITYISDSGEISYLDVESGIPHAYITSAIEEANGDILIGTGYMRDGALVELEKSSDGYIIKNIYSKEDGLPGEKVRQIFADDSTLWITTEYDGVMIKLKEAGKEWIDGRSVYLTKESGLSDNEIKCICKVNENYWLGGKYGLTIVPKNTLE